MNGLQKKLKRARDIALSVALHSMKAEKVSTEDQKIEEMGYAYERVLGTYFHNPTLRYFKSLKNGAINPSVKSSLLKSAYIADEYNVSYDIYVKSQFYWFHKWFRRYPKVFELCSVSSKYPAFWRIQEFLKIENYDKINVLSVVVGTARVESLDAKEVDKINRSTLNQVCKAYNLTEEEAILRFAPVGLFDLVWLKRQKQIYKKLREEGLI